MTNRNGNSCRKTVLVVDDEQAILLLLRVALGSGQYRVIVARGGAEALAAAENAAPDLLITDVSMPGLSGYEVARRLRANHRNTRVLYISGYPVSEEMQSEFVENSAYLQKPFRLDALMVAIHSLLEFVPLESGAELDHRAAAAAA